MRKALLKVHRYVGLVITLFLVIAGLTGCIIAFHDELDGYINQSIFYVPRQNQPLLDPLALRDRLLVDYPDANIEYVELETRHGKAIKIYLDPKKTDRGYTTLPNDELYADPYTGKIIGARLWGDIGQGWTNLLPFIYRLHYSLALKGVGILLFGLIALLWTLDCFVAVYLTFPARQKSHSRHELTQRISHWGRRWHKAWKIRWFAGFHKLNFDIHRAGGLWLWAVLFVFAWSSVGFNLQQVYSPVMRTMFAFNDAESHLQKMGSPLELPGISWIEARSYGRQFARQAEQQYGFKVLHESTINYDRSHGVYRYVVKTSDDQHIKQGRTRFYIDAQTGALKHLETPRLDKAGDIATNWLQWIHMARVFGLPMKICVILIGLSVTTLSLTGLFIWYKKRHARKAGNRFL